MSAGQSVLSPTLCSCRSLCWDSGLGVTIGCYYIMLLCDVKFQLISTLPPGFVRRQKCSNKISFNTECDCQLVNVVNMCAAVQSWNLLNLPPICTISTKDHCLFSVYCWYFAGMRRAAYFYYGAGQGRALVKKCPDGAGQGKSKYVLSGQNGMFIHKTENY